MGNKITSKSKIKSPSAKGLGVNAAGQKGLNAVKAGKAAKSPVWVSTPKSQGAKGLVYTPKVIPGVGFQDAMIGAVDLAEPTELTGTQGAIDREAELAGSLVHELEQQGNDVAALCETYQLKREELGRLTGFSLRALADWSSGQLPSQPAKRRLREVRRLLDALSEIVKRESIPKWLHQPNPAFDRLTPLQVIELGEMDRLWAMVHDMSSGQPG